MSYTVNQLQEIFKQVKQEIMGIVPFSSNISNVITLNRSKTTLGVCRCRNFLGEKSFNIVVSKYLLNSNIKTIKNTLAHELIHTVDGCFNHGYNFMNYAQEVNRKLGYNVSDKYRGDDFKKNYKWKITCTKCGVTFYRHKLPKVKSGLKHASDHGELVITKLY